jgi:hypothetical protein
MMLAGAWVIGVDAAKAILARKGTTTPARSAEVKATRFSGA